MVTAMTMLLQADAVHAFGVFADHLSFTAAAEAVAILKRTGAYPEYRQVLAVDANGISAIHSGPKALGTWAEARADALDALPGSSYRRLAMWRYLVEWTKPGWLLSDHG